MKNPEVFWDRVSKNFDNSSKKGINKPSRPILATKPYLNIDDSVLDFGCATGKNVFELSEYVNNIHGIDISSKMIEMAKGNVETQDIKNVEFTKTDIFDHNLQANLFDVIISFNVIHLLGNLDLVVQRLSKLLKPGGFLITNTPCLAEYKYLLGGIISFGSKLNLVPDVNLFKCSELKKIITNSNFEIIENRKLDQSSSNYFIVGKKN